MYFCYEGSFLPIIVIYSPKVGYPVFYVEVKANYLQEISRS
jgi:hypothetical protein